VRQQSAHTDHSYRQSKHTAGKGKQYALSQKLADNPPPARPDGRADRNLPRPHGSTCNQQVCDIRAGDQQHQQHRTKQHQQCRSDITDNLFVYRNDVHAPARIELRILLFQILCYRAQLCLCLRNGHAWFQSGNYSQITSGPLSVVDGRVDIERKPHVRLCLSKLKTCGHHSDNRITGAIERNRFADDSAISTEDVLP